MDKKYISSWGRVSSKEVTINSDLLNSNTTLPIGNLNSYGDSCIPKNEFAYQIANKNITNMTVLETMKKNNFRFFGIPGKANVTIAGAVASDVHGKDNLWGGPFSKNIKKMELTISGNKKIEISRKINEELFYSTIGGLGLTGVITDVEFNNNLSELNNTVKTKVVKGVGLSDLFKNFSFKESTYWSAWIDLIDETKKWVSFTSEELKNTSRSEYKSYNFGSNEDNISISLDSKFLLNRINNLYYMLNKENISTKSIYETFYPLNRFSDTRILTGPKGLIQIQFVVPENKEMYAEKLIQLLIENNNPILCSLKRLNNAEGLISFCKNGWTFALDFSYKNFNSKNLNKFYKSLVELGGHVYLAKDVLLDENSFNSMYTNIKQWKKIVKYYDPKNQFQSDLSYRLGMKNW